MQGRRHHPPFEQHTGGCAQYMASAFHLASICIVPAVAERRALRADVTYEDPTGSFATGGGAPGPSNNSPVTPQGDGLDWGDDADTNVLQPRHLPHSLITDSELEWDEHDEGSTELWNAGSGSAGALRGPQRVERAPRPDASGQQGKPARGPRLPPPTLSPDPARLQPTAAELARAAARHGAAAQRPDPTQRSHPSALRRTAPQRAAGLQPSAAQRAPAQPGDAARARVPGQANGPDLGVRSQPGGAPTAGAARPRDERGQAQAPGNANGQRRGTLPPAQPHDRAANGRQRHGTLPPVQPAGAAQKDARRGTLPPAQQTGVRSRTATPPMAATIVQPGAARAPQPAAAVPPPRSQLPGGRRNTPLGPQPDLTHGAPAPLELDPALAALDPRRQSTLVMHAPPRPAAAPLPQGRIETLPPPPLQLPAADDLEEDPIEQLQEQLFEAMARARAEQTRADRAEQRAQQAEQRVQQHGAHSQQAEQLEQRVRQAEQRAQHAEQRAQQLGAHAQQAEQRAQQLEQRAQQAEQRAQQAEQCVQQISAHSRQTEQRAQEIQARAQQLEARAQQVEARAQHAEARGAGLENRAQRAEAELQGTATRVQQAELQAQRADARARAGENRAQQAELRLRQLDNHLRQLEGHVHELRARAQEADERAQEAEDQLENLALANASAASSPLPDSAGTAAMQQLREQLAQAYEHIRVSEVRADEAERRAQAAERRAHATLHLAEEPEHVRPKKPSKLSLLQSALLASTLSFGVGAYFALFQPLQKRVQAEADLRSQEAAQHAQAISTLQAQRDAERRGLETQNQELRTQLEAARLANLAMDPERKPSRSARASAADEADTATAGPETRSARAIERRLRRRARAAAEPSDDGASERPAARERPAAPSRGDGNDPLDGL